MDWPSSEGQIRQNRFDQPFPWSETLLYWGYLGFWLSLCGLRLKLLPLCYLSWSNHPLLCRCFTWFDKRFAYDADLRMIFYVKKSRVFKCSSGSSAQLLILQTWALKLIRVPIKSTDLPLSTSNPMNLPWTNEMPERLALNMILERLEPIFQIWAWAVVLKKRINSNVYNWLFCFFWYVGNITFCWAFLSTLIGA